MSDQRKVKFNLLCVNNSVKIMRADVSAGEAINWHSSDRDAALLVNAGKVHFKFENESHVLNANESISIPANRLHCFDVVEAGSCLLILNAEAQLSFTK